VKKDDEYSKAWLRLKPVQAPHARRVMTDRVGETQSTLLRTKYVPTEKQAAGGLSKPLGPSAFTNSCSLLGIQARRLRNRVSISAGAFLHLSLRVSERDFTDSLLLCHCYGSILRERLWLCCDVSYVWGFMPRNAKLSFLDLFGDRTLW
jgi:hypothetical protein